MDQAEQDQKRLEWEKSLVGLMNDARFSVRHGRFEPRAPGGGAGKKDGDETTVEKIRS